MVKMQKSYKFKILPEYAVEKDAFDEGIHEKVADQLLGITNSSEQGITIGLEGPWGAGKSTVVRIFKNKLDNKTLFFNFDTWAHEGDPLRKVFLQSLINKIQTDEVTDEKNALDKLKDEISGKTKNITITTKFKSSKLGKWLGFSALFVPAGAAILSGVNYGDITPPWEPNSGEIAWWPTIAAIFALSPAVIVLFWNIFGRRNENENGMDWSLLEPTRTEDYTQDITEELEKTSVEFEEYFHRIIQLMVGENKKYNRAIIVVDNLDRVETHTAQRIWSTLQTFFQNRHPEDNELSKKIWFIIPYDQEGLATIWKSKPHSFIENKIYNSFTEKSIQIVLDVPTPVFSEWSSYLDRIVSECLYSWEGNERTQVISTIKRYISKEINTPTPRYLRRLINQIGAIGLRWENTVSTESKTLFALVKSEYNNASIQEFLITRTLPNDYQSSDNTNDIIQSLAGMLFGVSPKKGIELLLGNVIKQAIMEGDANKINDISKSYKSAFVSVCHSILPQMTPTSAHDHDYWLNFTKSAVEIFKFNQQQFKPNINYIIKSWRSEEKYRFHANDYTIIIEILFQLGAKEDTFGHIFDTVFLPNFSKLLTSITTLEFPLQKAINLHRFYRKLIKFTEQKNEIIYPQVDYNAWQKWLAICKSNNMDFNFALPNEVTITWCAQHLKKENIDTNMLLTLRASLPQLKRMNGWIAINDLLIQWLTNSPYRVVVSHTPMIANEIFHLLCAMAIYIDGVSIELKKALIDQNYINLFNNHSLTTYTVSQSVLTALVFKDDIQKTATTQFAKDFWLGLKPEIYDDVVKILEELDATEIFSKLSKDPLNKSAIKYVNDHSN